jgi:hypothetical protein
MWALVVSLQVKVGDHGRRSETAAQLSSEMTASRRQRMLARETGGSPISRGLGIVSAELAIDRFMRAGAFGEN